MEFISSKVLGAAKDSKCLLIIISIAISFLIYAPVMAEDKGSKFVSKDPLENEKSVRKFVASVFSNVVWSPALDSGLSYFQARYPDERFKASYPFIAEIVFREKGIPKHNVINKWPKTNIKVGFGWPIKGMPLGRPVIQKDMQYLDDLKPIIEQKIKEINGFGVIKLEFISPEEETENAAQIRIDPMSSDRVFIKFNKFAYEYTAGTSFFDGFMSYGVHFTYGRPFQVEGYFMPDENNQIELSVCHVHMALPKEVLASYVGECLLRSLGLPETLPNSSGVLGERKQMNEIREITSEDIKILSILYSKAVKPGDDQNKVINELSKPKD